MSSAVEAKTIEPTQANEPEANKLFRMVMKHKGSDLHLKVGLAPAMRLAGVLRQMQLPALSAADVGIAMGTGTDVAMESAGVTLLQGDLMGIVRARALSRSVMRNIRQNLFLSFAYNVAGIPLAAGVLYPFFGLLLSPVVAAAAMALSSVSVIANALLITRIGFVLSCALCFALALRGLRGAEGRPAGGVRQTVVDLLIGLAIAAPVFWMFTKLLAINLPGITPSGWI